MPHLLGQLDLFEVKWSESPDQKWFDRLLEVRNILKNSKAQRMGSSYMLCRTAHSNVKMISSAYMLSAILVSTTVRKLMKLAVSVTPQLH
jgi:hypothetical protein